MNCNYYTDKNFCYPEQLSAIFDQLTKKVSMTAAAVRVAIVTMREQGNA